MATNAEKARKIAYLMVALLKLTRKDAEGRIKKLGLSSLQYGVLYLVKMGNETISQLSKLMMLEPATLVPVIDALEQKGLLVRKDDPKDRRKNLLVLTAKANKAVGKAPLEQAESPLIKGLDHFGSKKTDQLQSLLEELFEGMHPSPKFLDDINRIIKLQN